MKKEQIEAGLESWDCWPKSEWSTEELRERTAQGINLLYARVMSEGDSEAVKSLVSLAEYISVALGFTLKNTHESLPGYQAVKTAAAESYLWPVMIPAMEEMRPDIVQEWTPENLGSSLPIKAEKRKGKGRTRDFDNGGANRIFLRLVLHHGRAQERGNATLAAIHSGEPGPVDCRGRRACFKGGFPIRWHYD